jgi:hypothetical protein
MEEEEEQQLCVTHNSITVFCQWLLYQYAEGPPSSQDFRDRCMQLGDGINDVNNWH